MYIYLHINSSILIETWKDCVIIDQSNNTMIWTKGK